MSPEQPSTRPAGGPATTSAPVAGDRGPQDLPRSWDDARDTAFFSLSARVFPPAVTLGMTVLLASYDDDLAPVESLASG